jgi:hypothetical protein
MLMSANECAQMEVIKLTEHVKRRIALEASVHPVSVSRYCQGFKVRGLAGERIEAALRKAGLLSGDKAQS